MGMEGMAESSFSIPTSISSTTIIPTDMSSTTSSMHTQETMASIDSELGARQARFEGAMAMGEENRFEQLAKSRVIQREQWEASQRAHPTDFMGTCPDMCPEFERHEREAHLDVSPFEMIAGTEGAPRIDHRRAVKKYHRPAAGNEAPLPEDVRPAQVLRQTMDYLTTAILQDFGAPFSDKHRFVRDRTRAIRQDITLQQRALHRNHDALLIAVRLHEEIARFHILSGHRLCQADFSEFDPFQNMEQLRKVLQSLQEYYVDIRRTMLPRHPGDPALLQALSRESEFRAYQLLAHAEDHDVFRQALTFPPAIFSSPAVQFALRSVAAYHQRDYRCYFRLVQQASYLQACLLHIHFARLRQQALYIMAKAYGAKESLKSQLICKWLLIEDIDELARLVEASGFTLLKDALGQMLVSFVQGRASAGANANVATTDTANGSNNTIALQPTMSYERREEMMTRTMTASTTTTNLTGDTPPLTGAPPKARQSRLIENKVHGIAIPTIIRGVDELKDHKEPKQPRQQPIHLPSTMPSPLVMIPSTTIPTSASTIPGPPSKRGLALEQIATAMLEDLVKFVAYNELRQLCQMVVQEEGQRRATLRTETISRIAKGLLNEIIEEEGRSVVVIALEVAQRESKRVQLERIKREALDHATQKVAESLLQASMEQAIGELLRDACDFQRTKRQFQRLLKETNKPDILEETIKGYERAIENVLIPLAPQPPLSPSSPLTHLPPLITTSPHISTPIGRSASAKTPRTLDQALFSTQTLERDTRALAKRVLFERIETGKFEEMLEKAVNS